MAGWRHWEQRDKERSDEPFALYDGVWQFVAMVRLRHYFPDWQNTLDKPRRGYPKNPQTIGDHIRKRRMDTWMWQADLSKLLGVHEASIVLWETNKAAPSIRFYPKIIDFLGWNPFKLEGNSLAVQIKNYRFKNGLVPDDFRSIDWG